METNTQRSRIVVLIKFDNVIAKVDEAVFDMYEQEYQPKRKVWCKFCWSDLNWQILLEKRVYPIDWNFPKNTRNDILSYSQKVSQLKTFLIFSLQ